MNVYVSPEGCDDNPGTEQSPFRTIGRARDAVRASIACGMNSDVSVLLRGGDYYLESTLMFDERDSGRDGFSITYRNYPGETPVVHGGTALQGWVQTEDGDYKAVVRDFHCETLYENGERCVKARHPKKGAVREGYLRVAETVPDAPKTKFRFAEGDIPYCQDVGALEVFLWPGGLQGEYNWFSDLIRVEEIDYDNRIVTLKEPARYEIGKGSRYYVQGPKELLQKDGEFAYDPSAEVLYYRPVDPPIGGSNIIVPTMSRIVQFRGSSPAAPVESIRLEGWTVMDSGYASVEDGAVYLENAREIAILHCVIRNAGVHGVLLNGWNSRHRIYGNHLYDIGHTGIQANGKVEPTIRYVNKNHAISNNLIHGTGQLVGHGSGIQLSDSGDNVISHNRIYNTSRYAISLKGNRPQMLIGKTIDGIEVTQDNAKDFAHSRNNLIEYNDVSNANVDSQDTGLIEAWGPGTGNIIHNNRLHHSDIHFSFGFGLYLDDAADDFTITNNLIDHLQLTGEGSLASPVCVKGIGNRILNNIVADNRVRSGAVFTHEMAGEDNRDLVLERNIFCNNGDFIYRFVNWSDDRFAMADRNLFYNESGNYLVSGVPDAKNFAEWQLILNGKYDRSSATADPGFIDPANGDYRVRRDSPAYAIGYQDIDFSAFGLLDDFRYADQR